MRPTGPLHLGHLVGALDNWARLQDEYRCLFMVADWHALMSEYSRPAVISGYVLDNLADWLSCGVDPKKSIIFLQSRIREHLDLFFILSCLVPLGWLERCPTYKEQMRELKEKAVASYGFLGYPVLQAADILLYKAEYVPIGEDQLPHLELTRMIARRVNSVYAQGRSAGDKKASFPQPRPLLTKFPRLLGLDARKMSNSYANCIYLGDEPDTARKKIASMFTDPKRIKLSDPGHPRQCNLYAYYGLFAEGEKERLGRQCAEATIGCTQCKIRLAEIIIARLKPIRKERKRYLSDKRGLEKILDNGAERASQIASSTMKELKRAMADK